MDTTQRKKVAEASLRGQSVQSSPKPTPPATPTIASTPLFSILKNATDPDVEKAIFNAVTGNMIIDPNAVPSDGVLREQPPAPKAEAKISILEGSKGAKARYAIFNSVIGDMYGFPQSRSNANTAADGTKHSEERESLR